MSGIIKFRAFYKPHNKMCYEIGDGCNETGGVNKIISEYQQDDNWVLMLSTGLSDKNNKQIYDGDIAIYYGKKFYDNYGYNPLIKIIWQEKTAKFVWEGTDRSFGFNPGTTKLMEVIGNIYEHKHLLEAHV